MSLQENVTEEDLMLNILIDEGIELDAPAKSHCSQKRKAADLECEDNLKEKRSLERVFNVLYIANVIDVNNRMRICPYLYLCVSAPEPLDGFGWNLVWDIYSRSSWAILPFLLTVEIRIRIQIIMFFWLLLEEYSVCSVILYFGICLLTVKHNFK